MNKRAQDKADAREDNRTRYYADKRFEERIRADERLRMIQRGRGHDRNDLERHSDDTGFTPGARGSI